MSDPTNDNVFESINLTSTVDIGGRTPFRGRKATVTGSHSKSIPESVSGTSDDDDLDPTEFISSGSPQDKKTAATIQTGNDINEQSSRSNNSTVLGESAGVGRASKSPIPLIYTPKIADNEFFSNPSRILSNSAHLYDSIGGGLGNSLQYSYESPSFSNSAINFPLEERPSTSNNDSESPIEFLSNKNRLLFKELMQNVDVHKQYLSYGDAKLPRRRSMISQNFEQLSENFYSLNELYAMDITYTETLYTSFRKWDRKRNKLLSKISSIKSDKNKHGAKLTSLLDESRGIDEEIEELERKLASLRTKKQLINDEIEDTSSVLESRTSKYVETFKALEEDGKKAMLSYLTANGIPPKELQTIIRTTPVAVTFSENYNNKLRSSTASTNDSTEQRASRAPQPQSASTMGIQPFVLPESSSTEKPTKVDDRESWNHGHGPTAYERGYAEGTESSNKMKNQINNFLHSVLTSLPEQSNRPTSTSRSAKTVKVDDNNNTITEKLELEPVYKLLEHKVGALSDLVLSTSNKATIYHEYGTVWKDIMSILRSQENRLSDQIAESTPGLEQVNVEITRILVLTLDQIKGCLESMKSFNTTFNDSAFSQKENYFAEAVLNEIGAIFTALTMVSSGQEIEGFISDFHRLGFPEKKLRMQIREKNTIPKSSPIPPMSFVPPKSISPSLKTPAIVYVKTEPTIASSNKLALNPTSSASTGKHIKKSFFGFAHSKGKDE
ncbi:uncharacterized protein RJT20DRAFT_14558 [Scheffersomyces xylosifermentans]|uniref:uncharacterized protein n=1 Tax=Scheffersomyces xylosifermentans TaxID=1304137 RepID=UPI00315D00FA